MANTLTNLQPDLYNALDIVSRELVGFIPAVTLDAADERAAKDQTIRVPITPASSASDITPGVTAPNSGDQTLSNTTITISKSRSVPFRWNGEEQKGINTGPGYQNLKVQQIAQAMRTLCNEVEGDIANLYKRASRAYGTAATAPFGSTPALGDAANVRRILVDNGCPENDIQLVVDTAAGVNLRSLTQLTKANEAGGDSFLRQGVMLPIFGMEIRESAQVKQHTKGTGTGYQLNNGAGYAVGSTTIAVDTGSGTIVAGDILTNTQGSVDPNNKYVVGTALSAGSLAINSPGNRVAWVDNDTVAVGNSYRANFCFHRSAVVLVARPPALPEEGDMADDRMMITDPRSGLTFEVSLYKQYRQVYYEVALAWGVACIKPEHAAILLG
jgi:hypothetical protein